MCQNLQEGVEEIDEEEKEQNKKKNVMKMGYKFITNYCDLKTSWMWFRNDAVDYSTKFITKPKPGCGPLFVFKNIEDALELLEEGIKPYEELWECRYLETKRKPQGKPNYSKFSTFANKVILIKIILKGPMSDIKSKILPKEA